MYVCMYDASLNITSHMYLGTILCGYPYGNRKFINSFFFFSSLFKEFGDTVVLHNTSIIT